MREFVGEIPSRIKALPVDKRGFPVPYFVKWIDGEPHFPVMDGDKLAVAINQSRCWICGDVLGAYKCFVIGPMCGVNRISAEPPSHLACARFAALNCPFMAHPLAKRANLDGIETHVAGIMIERNPGVSLLWITKSFEIIKAGGVLFRIGEPESVEIYAKGRRATRAEVNYSVETGLPALHKVADLEGPAAKKELAKEVSRFTSILDGLDWAA